ncbi:MAG: hypothetical protein J1F66_05165 [Clostridiales bacterium]|nr:hypothetical protein [Clostridiales bacterium]
MANSMSNVVIGRRQILRELKKNNIAEIIIAVDAEASYISSLIEVAKLAGVAYKLNGTMNEISARYNIDVPSGAVGILK